MLKYSIVIKKYVKMAILVKLHTGGAIFDSNDNTWYYDTYFIKYPKMYTGAIVSKDLSF